MIALVPVFGVLAGLLGVLDTIPYVRDMVRGTTRPHRGTWLIWSVLGCTVCFSQGADGATWSLVMAATQAVLTTGIFLLSLRWGDGGVSTGDWVALGIAGAGVVVWLAAEEPLLATACVVAVDLVAVLMMVPKTYRDPHSETPVTFALGSLSGLFAAFAVGAADLSLLFYPVYYCAVNGGLAVLIHRRRAVLAAGRARPAACLGSGDEGEPFRVHLTAGDPHLAQAAQYGGRHDRGPTDVDVALGDVGHQRDEVVRSERGRPAGGPAGQQVDLPTARGRQFLDLGEQDGVRLGPGPVEDDDVPVHLLQQGSDRGDADAAGDEQDVGLRPVHRGERAVRPLGEHRGAYREVTQGLAVRPDGLGREPQHVAVGCGGQRERVIYQHATQKADRRIADALERMLGEHEHGPAW
jgi:hypothetical protein